jgi:NADH dehydrogenase [ubiquinone] 1 alpha subcomplex assembly factor 1
MKTKALLLITTCLALGLNSSARAEPESYIIHDFADGPGGWSIEDDGVMGGLSRGNFAMDESGHGVFSGEVSLENDGGFSSVQYYFDPIDVSAYSTVCFLVKGDGKNYRFLVEAEQDARHYYEAGFSTSGEQQIIEIPFADMVAVRRGDRLDLPNFPGLTLAQVRFMIANGAAESFRLEIERVWLK